MRLVRTSRRGTEAEPESDEIAIYCPNEHLVFVHERHIGRTIGCPSCSAAIAIPRLGLVIPRQEPATTTADYEPEDEPDEDEPDDRPRSRRGRPRRGGASRRRRRSGVSFVGLDKVNIGLAFHYARLLILFFGVVGMFALNILMVPVGLSGSSTGATLLGIVGLIMAAAVVIVAPILGVVGSILCIWIPSQARARGLIITSLILDLTSVPVTILVQFVIIVGIDPRLAPMIGVLPAMIMGLTAWILFIVYLQKLSRYLLEEMLAEEAGHILMQGILLIAITPLGAIALGFLAMTIPCIGLIMLGLGFIVLLYFSLMLLWRQIQLIGSLRQVIQSRT